jgi:hypothetical protein
MERDAFARSADPIAHAELERDLRAEFGWVRFESLYRAVRARFIRKTLAGREQLCPAHHVSEAEGAARRHLARTVLELAAPQGALHLHATDTHLFVTSAGRLHEVHTWADVTYLTVSRFGKDGPPRICVAFGPFDERSLGAYVDDPISRDFIARARALPCYPADAESAEETSPLLVHASSREGPLTGPEREPRRHGQSAYR